MTKTISTRLSEEEIKELDEITEIEKIDRSALIRKLLLQQLKQYRMKKMAEYYRKGVTSLQEASTAAKVSLYEMMDYVEKEKIRPPPQKEEEILEELKQSNRLMEDLKLKDKTKINSSTNPPSDGALEGQIRRTKKARSMTPQDF